MATEANLRFRSLVAGSTFAAKQYYFCKLATAGTTVVPCDSAAEKGYGVSQNDAGSGEEVLVAAIVDGGKTKVYLGEAVTDGAEVTTDADGKCILANTTGDVIMGYASKDGAINTIGEIDLAYNGLAL